MLSATLVAAQALPFLELVSQGNRAAPDENFALARAMDPESWTSLWRSRTEAYFFYWEHNLHVGLPIALLAPLALIRVKRPEVFALVATAAFFALLAVGARSPLLPGLVEHVPGWSLFRLPSRYAIITIFGVVWFAALGLDTLLRSIRSAPRVLAPAIAAIVVAASVFLMARAYLERGRDYAAPSKAPHQAKVIEFLHARARHEKHAAPPRVLAPASVVFENTALHTRISSVHGFANPFLRRVWCLLHELAGRPPNDDPVNLPQELVSADDRRLAPLALDVRWDESTKEPVALSEAPRRVWLANRVETVRGWQEAVKTGASANLDPRVAVIEQGFPAVGFGDISPAPGGEIGLARIERFSGEKIEVGYASPSSALLVIAEAWYPGWSARLGQQDLPVIPVQGWMRGVRVPPGEGQVVFRYRSRWLPLGAFLSLTGLGIALIAHLRLPRANDHTLRA